MKRIALIPLAALLIGCSEELQQQRADIEASASQPASQKETGGKPPSDGDAGKLPGSAHNIDQREDERQEIWRVRVSEGYERIYGSLKEYRTFDGTVNNLDNPEWGASHTQLARLGPVAYADGISTFAGPLRKSAREISNIIFDQPAPTKNIYNTSAFLWQWGQFLDHDIDLTDGVADKGPDAKDFYIKVPKGDMYFDPAAEGDKTIPFHRAAIDPDTGNGLDNPRQQENEITAWIDASNVYGSSDDRVAALRVGEGSALMKLDAQQLLPRNTDDLPNANGPAREPTLLFLAGDVRANEQVGLTAMHTLFVREHNRLAGEIERQLPLLSQEEIFYLARSLVIAEIQFITYNEFLPALIGPNALPPYAGYDPNVSGAIFNEFSAAAYRFGHSAVNDTLLRVDADNNEIAEGHLAVRDAFFNAPMLLQSEDDIAPVLRGLALQPHERIDNKVIDDLRNFLFGPPGAGGFDLVALNIQRGRDHGVPSYNDMREILGFNRAADFSDISSDPAVQQALRDAFGSVDDVDLWAGGLTEDPLISAGSQLGPLFREILIYQFSALRDGDRFWYERDLSDAEKEIVGDVTLANIIRRNTTIGDEVPDNVFYTAAE